MEDATIPMENSPVKGLPARPAGAVTLTNQSFTYTLLGRSVVTFTGYLWD
jgi:hypothetical protein